MKKGGIVEKRGEEETKSMPQVPVVFFNQKQHLTKCDTVIIHLVKNIYIYPFLTKCMITVSHLIHLYIYIYIYNGIFLNKCKLHVII